MRAWVPRLLLALVVGCAPLAAVPAATPAAADAAFADGPAAGWAQDGYGSGDTGANPAETRITASTVASVTYRWSIVSPEVRGACARVDAPVVGDGRLFLTDEAGFGAYDTATGTRLWWLPYPDPGDEVTPVLALAGGSLVVATNGCASQSDPDGDLTAYDPATGAVRWTRHRDAPMYRMVVDNGVVAVAGGDAGGTEVSAYRLADGTDAWNRPGMDLSAPVSAGGRLLLDRVDRTGAQAVDIATGTVRWSTRAGWSAVAADPDGGRFLVASAAGNLLAVDAATGAVAWTAVGAAGAVAVAADRVYVAHERHLIALRAASGARVWDRNMYVRVGRPVLAGGVLYATVAGEPMSVLSPATGADLDYDALYQGAVDHAVVADGTLYVTTGRLLDAFTP